MILTVDTFAWMEITRGSSRGRDARANIESASRCFTPSIVLAEVASACLRDGLSDDLMRKELAAIHEASDVVPLDPEIAIGAAHGREELRRMARTRQAGLPGLGDGIVLATARRKRSQILTGDPHFLGVPEVKWIG